MTVCSILTGDLDFEPLVDSLVRLGVRTQIYYVRDHVAPEIIQAADQAYELTLREFYYWSSPQFRANHTPLGIDHRQDRPQLQPHEIIKRGTWRGREVWLYRPNPNYYYIYVHWGNELTEPSVVVSYPNVDKLELGFKLTYGDIQW